MVTWEQISMKWGCRDKGWNKGNRDEWRGVGDVMEIEWTWGGESVVEERWHRTNFVGDPSGIQYLTNTLCYTLDSQHLNISTQPGPSVSFIMPGTMLSKGPLQLVLPRLPRLPNTTVGNKTVWMFGSFGLCIEYIFDWMFKILEIFWHIIPHLSYMINQESRKSIGNFLRYNYFLPQVSFEQFCCQQLMSEKCQNWRLLLRCWLMSHD